MASSSLHSDERAVLGVSATVYYKERVSDAEGEVLRDASADGVLFLTDKNSVIFSRKRFLRGYDRHHWYSPSDVLSAHLEERGFTVEVMYPETGNLPTEIIKYRYEIEGDASPWVSALSKKLAPENSEVVVKEREIIKEIVKVRCGHCGNLYDERQDKCPHCGGR